MTFYQQLSKYYDEIFSASPGDMAFIKQELKGCGHLLDIGCGSGNKTEFLAEAGRSITAMDLDPDMISLARRKHARPGIEYRLGDMTKLTDLFPDRSFDALLCLGNTLVHLLTPTDLGLFFSGAARLLRPGGIFIIQILNYDHLYRQNFKKLPLIETDQVIFHRYYDPALPQPEGGSSANWTPEGICFRAVIEVKKPSGVKGEGSGRAKAEIAASFEQSVPLRPLFKSELDGYLDNDFQGRRYFGGYDGRPLVEDSFTLIAIAVRK